MFYFFGSFLNLQSSLNVLILLSDICFWGSLCPLLICTWIMKNQVGKIKYDKLDFWSAKINFEIDFVGYTGSKNQVWNGKFVELDFSKRIFQKSSTDKQGVCLLACFNHVTFFIRYLSCTLVWMRNQKIILKRTLIVQLFIGKGYKSSFGDVSFVFLSKTCQTVSLGKGLEKYYNYIRFPRIIYSKVI